eukprot:12234291-Heterocapsa_arctica.AAC.1
MAMLTTIPKKRSSRWIASASQNVATFAYHSASPDDSATTLWVRLNEYSRQSFTRITPHDVDRRSIAPLAQSESDTTLMESMA